MDLKGFIIIHRMIKIFINHLNRIEDQTIFCSRTRSLFFWEGYSRGFSKWIFHKNILNFKFIVFLILTKIWGWPSFLFALFCLLFFKQGWVLKIIFNFIVLTVFPEKLIIVINYCGFLSSPYHRICLVWICNLSKYEMQVNTLRDEVQKWDRTKFKEMLPD